LEIFMRLPLLLVVFASASFAESPIMFGVRGGVPFNAANTFGSRFGVLSTQRFELGPTLGVRLPFGLSVEGDALFHRQTLKVPQVAGFNPGVNWDSWQFPVMLKITPGAGAIAPVFGAGAVVRHGKDLSAIPSFLFNNSSSNTVGFVAGGGVRIKLGAVNLTPELRYTRWGGGSFTQSLMNELSPFSRHEASVLVGITF
jgi:hypothetical protein